MKSKDCIDLRSDTMTKPSDKMRDFIRNAEVGDELYGEDPTTNELEKYCANFFGKEAALFIPSGILGNQIAIRCHTKPGDQILVDKNYHLYYYESGPIADLARVTMYHSNNNDGIITPNDILKLIYNRHAHHFIPKLTLICIENTINALAGKIFPFQSIKKLYSCAKKNGIKLHLDGARLLNASIATGIPGDVYGKHVDSIMLSFSKGLGAPFGAILIGNKDFIYNAKVTAHPLKPIHL